MARMSFTGIRAVSHPGSAKTVCPEFAARPASWIAAYVAEGIIGHRNVKGMVPPVAE
jgi:hypothetical protein